MKNKHLFIPLFVFIGACLISLIYSIVDYKVINPTLATSTSIIQFNFDGASNGLDPNGNPFNPVDFLSDEVIENAAAKEGLNYDVANVKKYIAMENVVPQNIVKEINSYQNLFGDSTSSSRTMSSKDYRPVRYKFVLYQKMDNKLSSDKLNSFLRSIVKEYCASFYDTYKKSFTEEVYNDLFSIDDLDYIYQNQMYASRLNILMSYADELYNEHVDFIVESENENINGKSFKDIYLKAQSYLEKDSQKIDDIIIVYSLSKDVDRLKNYYSYLIDMLEYDRDKYTKDYNAVTTRMIGDPNDPDDDYKINPTVYVGTNDNVNQIQDDTQATYNTLLQTQVEIANTITSINKQIADYQDILDKLNAATPGSTEDTVKELISQLGDEYAEVDGLLQIAIEKYNEKYVFGKNVRHTYPKYNSASIFSTGFVTHTVKVAAPIVLATLLGISIYFLVREIRKQKKAA